MIVKQSVKIWIEWFILLIRNRFMGTILSDLDGSFILSSSDLLYISIYNVRRHREKIDFFQTNSPGSTSSELPSRL